MINILLELDWAVREIGDTIIAQFWATRIVIERTDGVFRICRLPSYNDVGIMTDAHTIDDWRSVLDRLVIEDHGYTDATQLGVR